MDDPQDAAANMGIDEALFRTVTTGTSPSTVRLYRWCRPSLSLGYRQSLQEACDEHLCREAGIDIVRRISGGRAVLHQYELTYCVTAPVNGPLLGLSVREIYAWVTGAIRSALVAMNVTVDPPLEYRPTPQRPEAPLSLPCFSVPTGHEIAVGGRKLVGSAQKRNKRGFLQHGSVLLKLDAPLWRRVTRLDPNADLGAVSLAELSKRPIDAADLSEALQEAFCRLFGEPPSTHDLSPNEKEVAQCLAKGKYASTAWTRDRRDEIAKNSD